MSFESGSVVRVPFPYTDRSTRQRRPALVLAEGGIGDRDALLWVIMITSAANREWPGDISLSETYARAGLPNPSLIRPCKIATIDANHAEIIGRVGLDILLEVKRAIRGYLGIA